MISPRSRSTFALLAFAATAASLCAQGSFSTTGEVVLATGQPAPGLPPGITVSTSTGLEAPVMDQNGTLLFRTRLADTGGVGGLTTSNDRCLHMGRVNGDLIVAVRADDPAPGIPGATLRGFSTTAGSGTFDPSGTSHRISPFGELLYFHSNVFDATTPANTPATSDQCLFAGPVGGLVKVLREGEEVPFYGVGSGILWGTPSSSSWQSLHVINSSGAITISNPLSGAVTTATDTVLATGLPGALTVIRREGDVMAPGPHLLGGEVVTTASGSNLAGEVAMNEAGQVLHDMKFLAGGSVTTANDVCLSLYTPGSGDVVIAREGQDAPGFAPGTVQWGSPSGGWLVAAADGNLTAAGETFLWATLIGTGVTANVDDQALYFGGAAGWTKVAQRDGQTSIAPGVLYNDFSSTSMSVNDSGTMAFGCRLKGTTGAVDDTAVFYGTTAGFTKILQENDAVDASTLPGLQAGTWFVKDLFNLGGSSTMRINGRGQMLFHIQLWNAAHTTSITPLVAYDPTLGLRLVLDTSDAIATTGGVSPTSGWSGALNLASTAGSSDGSGYAWFGNNGDWAGRLTLAPSTNGFAIVRGHVGSFVASPSAVPVTGGVPQNFYLDCGPANANRIYWVIATSTGTRPGFPSPLGPQQIPLNYDPLWTLLSINAANSPLWINTLGTTDANGRGIGPAAFVMPPGFAGFLGTTLHHAALVFDGSLVSQFVTEPSALRLF